VWRDVGIADQQKAKKQVRDDSIKQFSIQPHPTYLSTSKICDRLCINQPLAANIIFTVRANTAKGSSLLDFLDYIIGLNYTV